MNDINLIKEIKIILNKSSNISPEKASQFFKIKCGEYAEFEKFLGVKVPVLRKIAKKYQNLSLQIIKEFLKSEFNEERLFALIIIVSQYQKAKNNPLTQENIYQFYLKNIDYVNNWNLVDSSAHHIIGAHLYNKNNQEYYKILFDFSNSSSLWKKRISIIATWHFIKQWNFEYTEKIVKILINDNHDLIHKACGWMLREAGKRNPEFLINFLDLHHKIMPRTMLRYAIEKLSEFSRKKYLIKTIER